MEAVTLRHGIIVLVMRENVNDFALAGDRYGARRPGKARRRRDRDMPGWFR
jgi:hypothetical protein